MAHHDPHPAERSTSMPILFEGYGEEDGPEVDYEDRYDEMDDDEDEDDDSERAPLDIPPLEDDGRMLLPEGTDRIEVDDS